MIVCSFNNADSTSGFVLRRRTFADDGKGRTLFRGEWVRNVPELNLRATFILIVFDANYQILANQLYSTGVSQRWLVAV